MDKSVASPEHAIADIPDGATIAIAGFSVGHRFATSLILALRDKGTKNLCLVCNSMGGPGELRGQVLAENRQVRKIIAMADPALVDRDTVITSDAGKPFAPSTDVARYAFTLADGVAYVEAARAAVEGARQTPAQSPGAEERPSAPLEFASDKDFQFQQAVNLLKGRPVTQQQQTAQVAPKK